MWGRKYADNIHRRNVCTQTIFTIDCGRGLTVMTRYSLAPSKEAKANNCTHKCKNRWLSGRNEQWELPNITKRNLTPNLPLCLELFYADDASYHSVQDSTARTSNSKKSVQDWLTDRNTPFSADVFKTEMYEFIKLKRSCFKCYKVDRLLTKY